MNVELEDSPADPFDLFRSWMTEAEQSEMNDPNAAALATTDEHGHPSVRMVLIKRFDSEGFQFFTNAGSQKGMELAVNPWASLCMHWKSLRRQVRLSGPVVQLSDEESERYFHSRSRRSQIAAAVSHQSRPLVSRSALEQAVEEYTTQHQNSEIPRPSFWLGYALKPEKIEFWADGADRLHHRLLFTRTDSSWMTTLLYP